MHPRSRPALPPALVEDARALGQTQILTALGDIDTAPDANVRKAAALRLAYRLSLGRNGARRSPAA